MKDNKGCTYTKWYTYYERDDITIFKVYKTRYRRPNWWPENINSKGYKETVELATIHASLQRRYITGHSITGYYIDYIEWSKEARGLIDKLRVLKKALYIGKHELYATDWT